MAKMAIGCFFLGLSFLVMMMAAKATGDGKASLWWLVASTTLLTMGELFLSPVGLSLVTKLAPVRMVSMLMGAWFLSSFFGNYISGALGMLWETMSKDSFFLITAGLSFSAGLGIFAVLGPLKRAIGHGKKATVDV